MGEALSAEAEEISGEMQEWISVLTFIRNADFNRETLGHYLLESFAAVPDRFSLLLASLREALLASTDTKEQEHLAAVYLATIAPLADRFGMHREKNVLDERCFEILHPADFIAMKRLLSDHQREAETFISSVKTIFRDLLAKHGFAAEVTGRFKTLYSIHKKLEKKPRDLLELHDIFAFRIILENDEPDACFEVLNLLHDAFSPVVRRFKDYVSIPKINGYQSIHTCLKAVVPAWDWPVEIQIRTRLMDDFAKNGLASHWMYSQKKKSSLLSSTERRLKVQLQQMTRETGRPHRVYFFSAFSGDLFSLPLGGTVNDFAYDLHTDIGDGAQYALVNGVTQQLDYRIRNNDRIEIVAIRPERVIRANGDYRFAPSSKKKLYVR